MNALACAENKDGFTPLMGAASMGHADIVTALLAAGALADTRDNLGWTAYDAAMYNNQVASAQLVMQHRRARGET